MLKMFTPPNMPKSSVYLGRINIASAREGKDGYLFPLENKLGYKLNLRSPEEEVAMGRLEGDCEFTEITWYQFTSNYSTRKIQLDRTGAFEEGLHYLSEGDKPLSEIESQIMKNNVNVEPFFRIIERQIKSALGRGEAQIDLYLPEKYYQEELIHITE